MVKWFELYSFNWVKLLFAKYFEGLIGGGENAKSNYIFFFKKIIIILQFWDFLKYNFGDFLLMYSLIGTMKPFKICWDKWAQDFNRPCSDPKNLVLKDSALFFFFFFFGERLGIVEIVTLPWICDHAHAWLCAVCIVYCPLISNNSKGPMAF